MRYQHAFAKRAVYRIPDNSSCLDVGETTAAGTETRSVGGWLFHDGQLEGLMWSLPEVIRKPLALAPTMAANADPVLFLHRVQWHSSNGPTISATSKATVPHRH